MTRIDIINQFITARGYASYLEIGVRLPSDCFDHIVCDKKIGVDPDPNAKATYLMGSDEYFGWSNSKFDFCFVDGLHHDDQCERDILNALSHLNPGGVIMLHDCLPVTEYHQTHEWHEGAWNGDVWKAWVKYRAKSDYLTYTVNEDWGCGCIDTANKRDGDKFPLPYHLDWKWYEENVWKFFNIKAKPEKL